ncbi:golvesin C-terminal-like domain-containing protein [Streptomyces sp. NPDC002386]
MKRTHLWQAMTITACTALLVAGTTGQSLADSTPPKSAANGWRGQGGTGVEPEAIPKAERSAVLGRDYAASSDTAFTTSGDASGFHVLVADAKDGYRWRTAATLSEPGIGADAWIGNACTTASGKRVAVAYAPRTFTNRPELMARGAFTAVVDLTTGKVTKLPFTSSLAYFSPGCGNGERAVFTQLTHEGDKKQQTRLIAVDTATGRQARPVVRPGEVTSAIPVEHGIAAAHMNRIVRISGGKETVLAATRGVPFQLTEDGDGGLAFIDREQDKKENGRPASWAEHLPAASLREGRRTKPATVASGRLTDWDLTSSADGRVFVTGHARSTGKQPRLFGNPGGLPKGARLSRHGGVALSTTWADGRTTSLGKDEASGIRTARITLHALDSGKRTVLDAIPGRHRVGGAKAAALGAAPSPVRGAATGVPDASPTGHPSTGNGAGGTSTRPARAQVLAASPGDPAEGTDERYCSVARNDVRKQAFQPTPRQVEWAVDQAVVGELRFDRPANWKNTGMDGYSPNGLFPPVVLAGDPNGTLDNEDPDVTDRWHIPSQVMLGVTAQESNMWQATRFAVPGVTANSLIGNYYGTQYTSDGTQADPWRINFSEADCGYGITQATDGMRLAGKTKPGETALPPTTQEAVALDYAANIAYGVQILSHKWNDTYYAGMKVNDGHPQWIENWFFALWAYNSGFYNTPDSGGHQGLGWTNNPANPLWKANRTPFLENAGGGDDYSHAAHPQDWPYEEKVLGWAARPISAMFAPGDFRPGYLSAWWNSNLQRTAVKPPIDLFCDSSNHCDPSRIGDSDSNDPGQGACTLDSGDSDTNPHWLHCWWDKPAQWKDCDRLAECGHQVHRFNTGYPEQADANSYPPRCSTGLPSNALIVDDIPDGTTPAGSNSRGCGPARSDGTFTLSYQPSDIVDSETGQTVTTYPGKIDTHQIGAGYGNHFWFTHTRSPESYPPPGDRMKVTGTWKLGRKITEYGGQAEVFAHIPDHGAQTGAANYRIQTAFGTVTKQISQADNQSNKWVSLGSYRFTDTTPQVSLDNFNGGDGTKDIAFDALAFVPGDHDGLNAITFPEADPNAPDVDFVAAQDAKEVSTTSSLMSRALAGAPGEESCSAGRDGVTMCATYKPLTKKEERSARTGRSVAPSVAAAAGPVGWCKDINGAAMQTRTQGCMRGLLVLTASRDGAPVGNATVKVIQEINLDPKSNQFTTWTEVSLVNMTGISSTTMTSYDEECWSTTACSESYGTWSGGLTWTAGDPHVATRTNTFSWNKVGGGEDRLDFTWQTSWSTPDAAVQAVPKWSNNGFDVRCDNKVGGNTGCVFPKYTPTLQLNTKKYPAAASYYWVLMEKLASHPGSEKFDKPLHRLADETKAKENRDKMCMLAVAEWNPNPAADGTSCDEYPFAKSRESGGQTLSSGKYCVQMYADKQTDGTWMLELDNNYPYPSWNEICGRAAVPAKQNTDAGGDLGRFTSEIGLLDDDAYYVQTGFEYCDIKSVCNIS